jgi:hypothetical protein
VASYVWTGAVVAGDIATGGIATRDIATDAAFGVFLWLEVLDSDFLTFLCCHLIFLSRWFVLCQ